MKGLTTSQTMRRHVLRNALVPTVAVIGVQIGYLFGGIIGVEKIFNYNGMGQLMLFAAQRKDIPMLTDRRTRHRSRLHGGDPGSRLDHRLDEPAGPGGDRNLTWRHDRAGRRPPGDAARSDRAQARSRPFDYWSADLVFIVGVLSSADGSSARSPGQRSRRTTRPTTSGPATRHPARST